MHKSEEYSESKEKAYVAAIIEELKAIPREKLKVTSIQSASTQKLLNMTDEELLSYRNRDFPPPGAKAEHPETWAGTRKIDPFEFNLIEDTRRKPKNSIGQSMKSSASDERKENARQAFTCTPPTEITEMDKVTRLELIRVLKNYQAEENKTWWKRLKNKLIPSDTYRMIDLISDKEEWQKIVKEKK